MDNIDQEVPSSEGVKNCYSLLHNLTPCGSGLGDLALSGLRALKSTYDNFNIDLGPAGWEAISAIFGTLEAMAEEQLDPTFYVSSLDPGMGKTQVLIHFVKALIASKNHLDVSALVCIQRRDQISDIVQRVGLPTEAYAVLTSDDDMNKLGSSDPQSARVLFTTHQMVVSRCKGKAFQKAEDFRYLGRLRQVRIWDESILPGEPITIKLHSIAALLEPLGKRHREFVEELNDLVRRLEGVKGAEVLDIPNLGSKHKLSEREALGIVGKPKWRVVIEGTGAETSEYRATTISNLWRVFGKKVLVQAEGPYAVTIIAHHDTIPEDLAPALVLDASARVRATYQLWSEKRGGLVLLPTLAKDYRNLKVHHWNRSGSRTSWGDPGKRLDLIDGIASAIRERPDQEWLVVHFKDGGLEKDLLGLVPEGTVVHFVHWGRHDATNAYAEIPNVVIAGLNFYQPSSYVALAQLALDHKPYQDGLVPPEVVSAIKEGEQCHGLLQAVCRTRIRKGITGEKVNAYVIARASQSRHLIERTFPGATIDDWEPVEKPLTGKVGTAVKFIIAHLDQFPGAVLPFKDIMVVVEMPDRNNFRRNIRNHEDLKRTLEQRGIRESDSGKKGFAKIFAPYPVEEDDG
jgi:hypothetical protein